MYDWLKSPKRRNRAFVAIVVPAFVAWLAIRNLRFLFSQNKHLPGNRHEETPWGLAPDSCGSNCPILIAGVASDTGAWNALQSVLIVALKHADVIVVAHISGATGRLYKSGRLTTKDERIRVFVEPFLPGPSGANELKVSELLRQKHDITMVAPSTSMEGSSVGALALCSSSATRSIGIIEDRYATSLSTLHAYRYICPARAEALEKAGCRSSDMPCLLLGVADSIAREQALKHSPFEGPVTITGSPQFDDIVQQLRASGSSEWLAQQRDSVRSSLGVGAEDLVIFLAGQPEGDDEVLSLVVSGLKALATPRRVWVLARHHPRQSQAELRLYQEVAARAPPEWLGVPQSAIESFPASEDIVPAADVVISGYSSVNYFAMLVGITGVVYADTPRLTRKFHLDKELNTIPEVDAGAAWHVSTRKELARVIRELSDPNSREAALVREKQKELCRFHDGRAGLRAWQSLLAPKADL